PPDRLHCQLASLFSGGGCARVGGRPSSFEATSSQIWASCLKDTRISLVWAWRAHLKHSSAIARYSPAVFMKRCAFPLQDFLRVSRACALGPTQQRKLPPLVMHRCPPLHPRAGTIFSS